MLNGGLTALKKQIFTQIFIIVWMLKNEVCCKILLQLSCHKMDTSGIAFTVLFNQNSLSNSEDVCRGNVTFLFSRCQDIFRWHWLHA